MKLAILLSYLFAMVYYYFLGLKAEPTWSYFFFIYGYMWIPGLCALWVAKQNNFTLPFRCSFRKFLQVGIASFVLVALTIFFGRFFTAWQPLFIANLKSTTITLFLYFLFGLFIGPFLVLGQEMMWRGILYERFKHFGLLKASGLTGLIWGVWYIPLIFLGYNYPGYPLLGSLLMILLTLSLSPLLFYFREKNHSLLIPAAFHGMLNTFFGISFFVFENPNYLIVGPTGIIGIAIFALASIYAWKKSK